MYGSSSLLDTLTVSGSSLSLGILLTAPPGFELSTNPVSGYTTSLTLGSAGSVPPTKVYLRLSAYSNASSSPYTGSVSMSSPGASTVYSTVVSGMVSKFLMTLRLTDVIKPYGESLGSGFISASVATKANRDTITGVYIAADTSASSTFSPAGATYTLQMSAATGNSTYLPGNYSITYLLYSDNVSKTTLYIWAENDTTTYGTPFSTGAGSLHFSTYGLKNRETIGSVTLNFVAGNNATDRVNMYANSATVSAATGGNFKPSNYTLVYLTGNLNVIPAPLTITGNTYKIYGTVLADGAGSYAFSPVGLMNGDSINTVTIAYGQGAAGTAAAGVYMATATPTAATGGTFNASNYAITYIAGIIYVAQKPMLVSATAFTKNYGTQLSKSPGYTGFSTTDLENNETIGTVTLDFGTGANATDPVGTYRDQVTPTVATGGTFNASNYSITYKVADVIIAKQVVTISVSTAQSTKTYGQVFSSGSGQTLFTSSGLKNGNLIGSVTLAYGNGSVASSLVGTYTASITPSLATGGTFDPLNYSFVYTPADLFVTPANLTITPNNLSKVYGNLISGAPASSDFKSVGLLYPENIGSVTSVYTSGSSRSSAAGIYTGSVTAKDATGGTFNASNYSISYLPADLTVTPALLSIGISDITKVYGTTLTGTAGTTSFTSSGLKNTDLISSVSIGYGAGSGASDTVGPYPGSAKASLATGTGFPATNYTITYTPASIQVSPAPLTITATGPLKNYGSAVATTTGTSDFTASATVNKEVVNSVTLNPDFAGFTSATPAGKAYEVRPSAATGGAGFLASNYAISYVNYTGIVSRAALTITTTGPLKSYGQQLSASGITSQVVAGSMPAGESVSSVNYTVDLAGQSPETSAGTNYLVTPVSVYGSGGYDPSNYTLTYIPYTGTVSKASMVLSAAPGSKVYGGLLTGSLATTAFTADGLQNKENAGSVNLIYSSGSLPAAHAGTYSGAVVINSVSGGSFLPSNYTISYRPADLIVIPAILKISASSIQKVYGTALMNNPVSTWFTSAGLVNNESIGTVSTGMGAGGPATAAVNTYAGSVIISSAAGGSFLPSDYLISFIPSSIIVTSAPLSVLAANLTKTYGSMIQDSAFSLNYIVSGFKNGEVGGGVSLTFGTGAISTAGKGIYTGSILPSHLSGGSFSASNYSISYVPGNIIVSPALLTISPGDVTKLYGIELTGLSGSANFKTTGLKNAETVSTLSLSFRTGASQASLPGTYYGSVVGSTVTGGTFNPANYLLTYKSANLIVGTNTPEIVLLGQPDCSTAMGSFSVQNYNSAYTYTPSPSASVTRSGSRFIAPPGTYTLISTAPGSFASPVSLSFTLYPQPPAPELVITNPAPAEAPATVNLLTPSVTAGSGTGLVFSYFRDLVGKTALNNPGSVNVSGIYYIRATNALGCFSLKAVEVKIVPAPVLVIRDPPAVNDPSTVDITIPFITAGSSPGLTYTYYTDAEATFPVTDPGSLRISGIYYIKGTDVYGYSVLKKVLVTINYQIYIPNIFTPNGDGKNDLFEIVGLVHFPGSSLLVFNRWGNEIYHSGNYQNTWNGSDQVPGTYYYALTLNNNGITRLYRGWVQIMH